MARLAGHVAMIAVALGLLLSSHAMAQQGDDLSALDAQVTKLYGEGKYGEAIPLAQRSLAIYEKSLV